MGDCRKASSLREMVMRETQSKPTEVRAWPADGVERRPIERLRPSSDNTRVAPHGNVVTGLAACDLLPRAQITSAKHHVSLIPNSGTSVIAEMTDRVHYGLELYPDYFEVVVWQLFTARAGSYCPSDRSFGKPAGISDCVG